MKAYKQNIILITLLAIITGCSQKQPIVWIPFHWEDDTISGKYIEKAFIFIPVKIEGLTHDFTMQLDLGTNQTLFYGNTINPYMEKYSILADKYEVPMFRNINLHMGPVEFNGLNIGYYNHFGEKIPLDSIDSKTPRHVGTIASDIFRNKIVVIDYTSCRMAVLDSLPVEYKHLPAKEFELSDGIMKIPFRINGNNRMLLYDTGSSPFQLVTSKERALEISDSQITDSLSGPLWWGKEITFYGLEVNKPIEFGGKALDKSKIYYDKEGLWNNIFDTYNVWGITGNAYFFDNTVIIDYKNKLFRIK